MKNSSKTTGLTGHNEKLLDNSTIDQGFKDDSARDSVGEGGNTMLDNGSALGKTAMAVGDADVT